MPTKTCGACRQDKPLSEFYRSARSRDGHQHRCKGCQGGTPDQRRRMQRHRRERPDLARKNRARERQKRYGITAEDFDHLLIDQSGLCAGCSQPLLDLAVDHDHATGHVRGLLCRPCNLTLGTVSDDPARLRALADYVEAS